ncbi:MAG: peptide chain release factor 1 [Clostridia bacterium]|nr:peptide chain release factor 1 [Clostridia bacterium]
MFNRLNEAEKRYLEIEEALANPDTASNQGEFTKYMREYKNLTPVIEKYREYKKVSSDMEGAKSLMEEESGELYEIAVEEYKDCKERITVIEEELKILLIPKDPNDDKNVVVEIRAGAGGEEAALFAYDLYRMYSMYAQANGFKFELTGANETGLKGFKEVTFMISGEGAYSRFKFESGVHRVQRVPETEAQGRVQTSTATVAVLPEAEDVEVDLNMGDVIVETCKSSGAGGQHVNKTESAIRLIHKPTGIVVECQDERSQFKNKDKAFKILRTKLYDMKQQEQNDKIASERKSQVGTGDRSEKIRTYNYQQSRVTDHRIGFTIYSLESFLNGDIGEMLDKLATADAAEKLKNGNN